MYYTLLNNISLYQRFAFIRQASFKGVSLFSSLALILASIFLIIYMVKLSYEIMSDEQGGGFGGVQVRQILRPVVMVIIVASFPTVIGVFDNAVTLVAEAMCSTTVTGNGESKLMRIIEESSSSGVEGDLIDSIESSDIESESQAGKLTRRQKAQIKDQYLTQELTRRWGDMTQKEIMDNKAAGEYYSMYGTDGRADRPFSDTGRELRRAGSEETGAMTEQQRRQALVDFSRDYKNLYEDGTDFVAKYNKVARKLKNRQNRISGIAKLLYDTLFPCMVVFSELYLFVLAIFGIFNFAVSVLDAWKDTYKSWIGKYIEVSLWKVVASLIVSAASIAKSFAFNEISSEANQMLANLDNGLPVDIGALQSVSSVSWTCTMINLAAIVALFSTPAITNAVMSLAGGGPAMGGAATGAGVGSLPGKTLRGSLSTVKDVKQLQKLLK